MASAINSITALPASGTFILALALIGPALNSYISNFAGDPQDMVMGMNSAFTSLGRVVGPLWGGYIYNINIEHRFFSGAATLLFGWLISFMGLRRQMAPSLASERVIHHL